MDTIKLSDINTKLGLSDILATTGDAEDKVMSLKAVSDLINSIQSTSNWTDDDKRSLLRTLYINWLGYTEQEAEEVLANVDLSNFGTTDPLFLTSIFGDMPFLSMSEAIEDKLNKTGTAASSKKLETPRSINVGTAVIATALNFDGTSNITIPVNSVKEAYLTWGGKDLKDPSPMDAVLASELGANRFAFLNTAGVTIEQSTDGGSTWTESTHTDAQKKLLFGPINKSYTIATPSGATGQLRITIKAYTNGAANSNLLTGLRKFIVYFVRVPSLTGCKLILEGAKYNGSFAKIKEMEIYAWPGFNVLNLDSNLSFGAFSPSSSSYEYLRFTFTNNHATSSIIVGNILAFGGSGNVVPSTMATNGHLYSYDVNQNATFPAYVLATSFPQSSDIRLKENINEITDEDITKSKRVEIKEYTLIEDETKTKRYGVIAQELESLGLNHLIVDGEVKAVDYISLLCLKIKSLELENINLQKSLTELKEKVDSIINK